MREFASIMQGKKILGSKLCYGIILGVIIAIICFYFLSNALSFLPVLAIAIGIIIIVSIIGYVSKNKIKKFELRSFDEKLIKNYFQWTK